MLLPKKWRSAVVSGGLRWLRLRRRAATNRTGKLNSGATALRTETLLRVGDCEALLLQISVPTADVRGFCNRNGPDAPAVAGGRNQSDECRGHKRSQWGARYTGVRSATYPSVQNNRDWRCDQQRRSDHCRSQARRNGCRSSWL